MCLKCGVFGMIKVFENIVLVMMVLIFVIFFVIMSGLLVVFLFVLVWMKNLSFFVLFGVLRIRLLSRIEKG